MSTVAETILQQLGGRRFIAMTGARSFVGDDSSLTFNLPIGKVRRVKIDLSLSDTYTVTFWARHGDRVDEVSDVYVDVLCPLFSQETGLQVSL